ncbi:MAG: 2-oxoglutarate and iron-dependent oxygenase domain-containing protein [Acidimicrobiales bacterium]
MDALPVIDVAPLVRGDARCDRVGEQIDAACREFGFFYISGHGVDDALQQRLEGVAHQAFALPESAKGEMSMAHGGRAWRGWFPLGGELTSGRADHKEGIYFGAELPLDDPRVVAGTPLHGPNVFPVQVPALREVVLAYLDAMTSLGHALLRGIGLGLGLDGDWFDRHLTADPLTLFRIFRYPPESGGADAGWGVAEHTDYGLLTILRQDAAGGLEVHARSGWMDAPPLPGTFVCNLGDMLERMTGGRYRSTPHRVRNTGTVDRLSFPFFFDPAWDAQVVPVPLVGEGAAAARARWDGEDVLAFDGTYGEYLLGKVGRVFPALRDAALLPPHVPSGADPAS